MLKEFFAAIRQLVTLLEEVKRLAADQKETRKELRELAEIVRDMRYRHEQESRDAAHEREKLLLRLDNALLRFERRLPPGKPDDDTEE